MENLKLNLENLKNQCEHNQFFNNCILVFVTFFLLFISIMSNSIVSAYEVEVDGSKKSYSYYFCYTMIPYNGWDGGITYAKHYVYYNSMTSLDFYSWFASPTYSNDDYYVITYYYNSSNKLVKTNNGYGENIVTIKDNVTQMVRYSDFYTNDSELVKKLDGKTQLDLEFVKTQTPTVNSEQVGEIPQAILRVMKIVLPLGLAILVIFLGIYLIRHLVALFL